MNIWLYRHNSVRRGYSPWRFI